MKKATTKRPNPNDATFRNITALKKRVSLLETRVDQLKALWEDLHREWFHGKQTTIGSTTTSDIESVSQVLSPVTNPLNDDDPPTGSL